MTSKSQLGCDVDYSGCLANSSFLIDYCHNPCPAFWSWVGCGQVKWSTHPCCANLLNCIEMWCCLYIFDLGELRIYNQRSAVHLRQIFLIRRDHTSACGARTAVEGDAIIRWLNHDLSVSCRQRGVVPGHHSRALGVHCETDCVLPSRVLPGSRTGHIDLPVSDIYWQRREYIVGLADAQQVAVTDRLFPIPSR